MRCSDSRAPRILGLLLYLAFSPAGIEVAHAASHVLYGDSHRQPHGVERHLIVPEGASTVNRQETPSRVDAVPPSAAPAISPQIVLVPLAARAAGVTAAQEFSRGPSRERAPPA